MITLAEPHTCSIRALSAAKLSTALICSCKVAREVVTVRMSSVWANAPAYVPDIDGPRPLLAKYLRSGSIIRKNKTGDSTDL